MKMKAEPMRIATYCKLSFCAAAAVLAGCDGSGDAAAPIMARALGNNAVSYDFLSPNANSEPLVFVSDNLNGVVNIYLQRPGHRMVGQITGLLAPNGITTDAAANLYVPNDGGSNVLVYAPPYSGPPALTLRDPAFHPTDAAVSRQGVVAVANVCPTSNCAAGPGNVRFYARKANRPCATVTDATNFASVDFDAFDDAGNLYINGFSAASKVTVGEVSGGCRAKKITLLTTKNTLVYPGGIQIDKLRRIAIQNGSAEIDTYRAPVRGALGKPVLRIPLANSFAVDFAFLASGGDLYTAEQSNPGVSSEYDYPAGGAAERTISVGGRPLGVAVTPPLLP
jgi:hypothetical protein